MRTVEEAMPPGRAACRGLPDELAEPLDTLASLITPMLADAVIAALSAPAQELARALFLRLITRERTRAIVSLRDLADLTPQRAELERLIDQLVHARLLVVQDGDGKGTKPGRVAHTQEIVLAPGQHMQLTLAPAYPDRLVTVRRWPAWRPWAVVAAGALVVAGGGALDWRAVAADDYVDGQLAERCTGDAGCEPDDVPASVFRRRERGKVLRAAARATFAGVSAHWQF